jgi:putative transposase
MTRPHADVLHELVAALEEDDTLVADTSAAIREALPGYESVPVPALDASVRRNRVLSIRTLLAGRAPEAAEISEASDLALERMGQGVPIGSVLAGFRLCMRVILQRLLELAPRHGLAAEEVLTFSTLLWSLGDEFSTRAVVTHQERSVAQAVADSSRRARWIEGAVVTGLPRTELLAGAAAYGVPTDRPVRAVLIAAHDRAAGAASRVHAWAERNGLALLSAPHGDTDVGLLSGAPAAEGAEPGGSAGAPDRALAEQLRAGGSEAVTGTIVALGPAVELPGLPASFAAAGRVLEAARAVGREGVVDLESLSWRMGIAANPEITALLHDRHLAPLRAEGQFGEHLLEAVRAYLAHGLSIPRAAASIPVHANTLRYRLKRFHELTGTDLSIPEDLVEVSWALAAEAGRDHQRS